MKRPMKSYSTPKHCPNCNEVRGGVKVADLFYHRVHAPFDHIMIFRCWSCNKWYPTFEHRNWGRHQEFDDKLFDSFGEIFDFITEMMEYQHEDMTYNPRGKKQ